MTNRFALILTLFLLTLVGCESPPDRSIPLMYGTVIDKGNLSGTIHEEARIVNGKLVEAHDRHDECYIVRIINPQGRKLQQNISKEVYDKIDVGQKIWLDF